MRLHRLKFVAFNVLVAGIALSRAGGVEPPEDTSDFQQGDISRGVLVQGKIETEASARIAKAIDRRISVSYSESSLADVVDDLERKLDIDILLDQHALDEMGIDGKSTVSIALSDVTGRSTLAHILQHMDPELTWYLKDEAIAITTREAAENDQVTRVYDVRDLVTWADENNNVFEEPTEYADYDGLIEIITKVIEPDSWEEVGGPGSIAEFQATGIDVLVVTQVREVHEKVALLLAKLRSIRDATALEKGARKRARSAFSGALGDDQRPERLAPLPALNAEPNREAVVQAVNQFGCDIYKHISANDATNHVFSPYSVWTALAMIYGGARDESADELRSALHIELEPRNLHAAVQALRTRLSEAEDHGDHRLTISNGLWGQQGYAFEPKYLQLLRTRYAAPLAQVDFGQQEAARNAINAWVSTQTDGMIEGALPQNAINEITRMILVNTVYFKGRWSDPFEKANTASGSFATGKGSIATAMMHQQESCRYGETDAVQVLEKTYAGNAFSMLVVLPKLGSRALSDEKKSKRALTKLAELEASISTETLKAWRSALGGREVKIYLPRFKFNTSMPLKQVLAALGIRRVFEGGPRYQGLAGIAPENGLYIGFIQHEAVVETDEAGTRAAAVTFGGAFGGELLDKPPPIPVFRADHPFLFVIRDTRTGANLFIGRVTEPERWEEQRAAPEDVFGS